MLGNHNDILETSVADRMEGRDFGSPIIKEISVDDINAELTNAYYQDNPDSLNPNVLSTDNEGNYIEPIQVDKRQQQRNNGYTILNQSLIKVLVDKWHNEVEFCPRFIKESYIDKTINSIPSDAMMRGKFFESHCLGGTTGGDLVLDLPRKKLSKPREAELRASRQPLIGDKGIDQIRIEEQIERFKMRCEDMHIQIVPGHNTHLTILKKWDERYMLAGECDIFPVAFLYEGKYTLAILDLKLTESITSTFGAFCWGDPDKLDHIQGDMYHYLVRDIDYVLNPHLKDKISEKVQMFIDDNDIRFIYWVWGYKGDLINQEVMIERLYKDPNGNDHRQRDLKERIRKTIAIIEREEQYGWKPKAVSSMCRKCPNNKILGGDCKQSTMLVC